MLTVQKLTCEYQFTPLGLDSATPRLGWKLDSSIQATAQTAYQIKVMAFSPDGKEVWDSGRVEARKSYGIAYAGKPLESRTRYYWNVRVWDNHGREASSDMAWFETALMNIDEWKAKWITPQLPPLPDEPDPSIVASILFKPRKPPENRLIPCSMLRRNFSLAHEIKKARLYATAHGVYKMEINGTRVGNQELAPEFSAYHKVLYYQTYDITNLLVKGGNAIGAIIADGWYCGHIGMTGVGRQYGDRHALLLQMEIELTNGEIVCIVSDNEFRCTNEGPHRYSDLFIGEMYDARREIIGWSSSGYDATGWKGVDILPDTLENLIAFTGAPVRRFKELTPIAVIKTPNNDTVIDVGQVIAGRMQMRVQGLAGIRVSLEHGEVLNHKGNFINNIMGANKDQKDCYILKGGEMEEYEPAFTFHGFRYVRIKGYPGEVKKENFKAIVIASDLEQSGGFSTSNPKLNRLQSNITWSQYGNMVSIPTDCPQREKAGWTGDIQVYAPTAVYNQNALIFLSRWMQSLRAEQFPTGEVPFIVPYIENYRTKIAPRFKTDSTAGWGDACIIVPYELYLRYGDVQILRENYEVMKKWMGFISRLWESGEWTSKFHYGDWMIPSISKGITGGPKGAKMTKEFVASAYYVYSCDLMSKIAGILDKSSEKQQFDILRGKLKNQFADQYIDGSGVFKNDFQGYYVLALQFGLIPDELKNKYVNRLVHMIEQNGGCLDTGFLSVPFILDVLCENKQRELAYKILYQEKPPSWLYEVNSGATTIWESWEAIRLNGKVTNASYNHYAFGCVGDWMYRNLLGINNASVGYEDVVIHPRPDASLQFASGYHETPLGEVAVNWAKENGNFLLNVKIPCNASALIIMPDGTQENVGSGEYKFKCQY